MVLLLAERLEVPIRERNQLLLAAGHAPAIPEYSIGDPELAPVREALDLILAAQEPYPAVVVDRGWNLVAANSAMMALGAWVDPAAASATGQRDAGRLASARFGPLDDQSARGESVFSRTPGAPGRDHRRCGSGRAARGGGGLSGAERARSRSREAGGEKHHHAADADAWPDGDELSLFATVATFGTAAEVTTSELSIELTFPADAATAEALRNYPAGNRQAMSLWKHGAVQSMSNRKRGRAHGDHNGGDRARRQGDRRYNGAMRLAGVAGVVGNALGVVGSFVDEMQTFPGTGASAGEIAGYVTRIGRRCSSRWS